MGGKRTGVRPACRRSRLSVASDRVGRLHRRLDRDGAYTATHLTGKWQTLVPLMQLVFGVHYSLFRLGMSKVLHVTHFPKPQAVRMVKCQEFMQRIP